MTLGEKIKAARKEKGITQKELSKRIGKGFSTVQKYEIDVIEPPFNIIEKIAAALEIPVSQLLDNVNILDIDANLRNKTQTTLDLMAQQLPKSQLLEAFDNLTEEGQSKVIDYANDITPKYKK